MDNQIWGDEMTNTLLSGRTTVPRGHLTTAFQAWKRPVEAPWPFKVLDHACIAYASTESSPAGIFQCFGHDADVSNFTKVVDAGGPGDYTVADMHRCPPKDSAGIRYLITGVCHQAANRFLSCVSNGHGGKPTLNHSVAGYALSCSIYGECGSDWTPWMTTAHLVEDFLARISEIEILIETNAVRRSHEKMLRSKVNLDASGVVGDDYADQFNAFTDAFQRELMDLMSADDYERLMGVPSGQITRLVTPDMHGLIGQS
jgi:hypothetical protein